MQWTWWVRKDAMHKLVLLVALGLSAAGCSPPAPQEAPKKGQTSAPAVKITQFYAAKPKLGPGEQGELCYGVENAESVWVSPPRQDLPRALTRCFTVASSKTTTYRLTAQGADGQSVTQDTTITVGAAQAHISEVRVSTLDAKAGDTVSLCYSVTNTVSVKIDPIGFKGKGGYRCVTDQPRKATTYVVIATGADGGTDSEKVTVKVH